MKQTFDIQTITSQDTEDFNTIPSFFLGFTYKDDTFIVCRIIMFIL